jgi:hypothetical protein
VDVDLLFTFSGPENGANGRFEIGKKPGIVKRLDGSVQELGGARRFVVAALGENGGEERADPDLTPESLLSFVLAGEHRPTRSH